MGWRAVTRSVSHRDVALERAGERRPHLVLADVAEHGADLDGGAVGESGAGVNTPAAGLTTSRSLAKRCSPSSWAGLLGASAPTHSMSLSRSSGVATEIVRASATVRLAMPVSTPPGPSSAYSVTPRSSSSRRQCFQRTGDDSCADRRLAHSLPSWWGRASTLAMTGTSVSHGRRHDRPPQRHTRRDHERGVEGAGHRQRHDLLGAELAGVVQGQHDPGGRAGDDHLPGGVVVGDPDVFIGAPAGHVDLVVVEPEDGRHRAGLGQTGLVHRLGAGGHEADGVVEPSTPVAVSAVYSPRLSPRRSSVRCPRTRRRRAPSG